MNRNRSAGTAVRGQLRKPLCIALAGALLAALLTASLPEDVVQAAKTHDGGMPLLAISAPAAAMSAEALRIGAAVDASPAITPAAVVSKTKTKAKAAASVAAVPKPATGELYRDPAYAGGSCTLIIQPPSVSVNATYCKIYAVSATLEETLVSTIFINAGEQATVILPTGVYVFKAAFGKGDWYGETEMFGAAGTYQRLKSSEASEYFTLLPDYIYTLMLWDSVSGNVGSVSENRATF